MTQMKITFCSFTFIFTLILTSSVFSQETFREPEEVFGPDPLLYNGKKYSYFMPSSATGHQFLFSPDFSMGQVSIRQKTFKNLWLNYDVYNQELLLKYEDKMGTPQIIELSKAWLESFQLEGRQFLCLGPPEEKRFYQVCGDREAVFLFYWKKEFGIEHGTGPVNYAFGPASRDLFLMIGEDIRPFRSKRSLLKGFDPVRREEIKAFIRKNRLHIKTATPNEMTALANFISRTIE